MHTYLSRNSHCFFFFFSWLQLTTDDDRTTNSSSLRLSSRFTHCTRNPQNRKLSKLAYGTGVAQVAANLPPNSSILDCFLDFDFLITHEFWFAFGGNSSERLANVFCVRACVCCCFSPSFSQCTLHRHESTYLIESVHTYAIHANTHVIPLFFFFINH